MQTACRANYAPLFLIVALNACVANAQSIAGRASPALMLSSIDRPEARETVIHTFLGGTDGAQPSGEMISDDKGRLYGVTLLGANNACYLGCGTVFRLMPSASGYTETILYRFNGGTDGMNPSGGLVRDATGALYGVTQGGGNGTCNSEPCGVVFKLTPSESGYTESVLYRFTGYPNDGSTPYGRLIADSSGTLYGTTAFGGSAGQGTVFKLTPNASGYTENVLYNFQGGQDGGTPIAGLMIDHSGVLYGTTQGDFAIGTAFSLTPSGSVYAENVLHRFNGGLDGKHPTGSVLEGANGKLYGTTLGGGDRRRGTAFELVPSGSNYTETVLHRFGYNPQHKGAFATGPLLAGSGGVLFGTTTGGGTGSCALGCGVVYELRPSRGGYEERVLHYFAGGADGGSPSGGVLMSGTDRTLFGLTTYGGQSSCYRGCGTAFAIPL